MRPTTSVALGAALFVAAWELLGRSGWLGTSLPALSEIVSVFETPPSRALFLRALRATAASSAWALALATLAAVAVALLVTLLPPLERGMDVLASGLYAIPTIAFGPVLILLAGPDLTPIVLGTLSAYFPIHVAVGSHLRYVAPARRQLAEVLGARRWRRFVLVDVPGTVPSFIDGLRLAAPAAILGAVLGEWFGAPRGLGVIILSSLQSVRIAHMWAAAVLCVACSLLVYVALSVLHRRAVGRFAG